MKNFLSQQMPFLDPLQAKNSIELPLKEIHLPTYLVDQTSNLFIFFIFFTLILSYLFFYLIQRSRKPSLKKEAIKKFKAIQSSYEEIKDPFLSIKEISIFLRRVVVCQKNQQGGAGLTGDDWLKLLEKPLEEPLFSKGVGRLLLTVPYSNEEIGRKSKSVSEKEINELFQICQKWVDKL